MPKKGNVPDAWEDDWEAQADRATIHDENRAEPDGGVSLTRAERLAKHVETNRKLWESAEAPAQTFHYVEANNPAPAMSNFKPQVKVLSRKPMIAKKDPVTGLSQLTLDNEPDEGCPKETQLSPEEVRAKMKRDREEKQRRYDEARAKIFGESAPSSGASSPGTVTPPRSDGGYGGRGGRGRGRGGGGGQNRGGGEGRQVDGRRPNNSSNSNSNSNNGSNFKSSNGPARELYDPNYSPRLDLPSSQRPGQGLSPDSESPARRSTPRNEQAPIRAPRGPDANGSRGFNFARRGGKEA